jgi:nucleoid-associated protein YgaU
VSPHQPQSQPNAVVASPQSPPPPSTSPNRPQAPPPARQSATPHLPAVEPRSQTVRVRPGDSLWLIAARRVGPAPAPAKVAAEWPRWYARNRTIIGPDPSLLLPGQQLTAPDGARPGATP